MTKRSFPIGDFLARILRSDFHCFHILFTYRNWVPETLLEYNLEGNDSSAAAILSQAPKGAAADPRGYGRRVFE